MCISTQPPEGKIRIIGRECGRDWIIADIPDDTNEQEIRNIIHDNRGAGIEVTVHSNKGEHDR